MEFERLKNNFPDWEEDISLELTTAMIGLSELDTSDNLPADLRAKIFANAEDFFNLGDKSQKTLNFNQKADKVVVPLATESVGNITDSEPRKPFWQWLGWGLAATACVALAISLWLARTERQPEIAINTETTQTPEVVRSPENAKTPETVQSPETAQIPEPIKTPESAISPENVKTPETAKTPESARTPKTVQTPEAVRTPEPVRTPIPELTAAQKREQLIASAPDVIQTNWTSAKDDKRVLGDVVWSNAQQKGYVRLRDMPILDASKETYQLWIFDDERNEKTPVSGGIFNVSRTGESIIPINAQVRIIKPKQFAVTKEKAGGVVVSKPDRIVAVAKI